MRRFYTATTGYPRIGENQEWKSALESYWNGQCDEYSFIQAMKSVRLARLASEQKAGIDWIASNDFSYYDHMLDMTAMFGLVPERFAYSGGPVSTALYFAMARGSDGAAACQLAPWFGTAYHYVVPELGAREPKLVENRPLQAYLEAKAELGLETKPAIVGPLTYIKLSSGIAPNNFGSWAEKLLPLYEHLLKQLEEAGASWVQMNEPCLSGVLSDEEAAWLIRAYETLHRAAPKLKLMLQIDYGPAACYAALIRLPVAGIGLDFVQGKTENMNNLSQYGFPADKRLGIGLIDGQSVWRTDLLAAAKLARAIYAATDGCELILQPSCSLLHVPVTLADESALPPNMKELLAFAAEKLGELRTLERALNRIGTAAVAAEDKIRESAYVVNRRSSAIPSLLEKQMTRGWVQACGARCVKPKIS